VGPVPATSGDDLLDAAARAFERHGYDGATLERIAAEAGVTRMTLHRRGITKDALLEQLAERATAAYRDALWPALTARGSARERLELALAALCESAEQNLALLVTLGAQRDRVFHEDDREALTRSVFTEPLERILRDGAEDGSLRPIDPVEGATVAFNLVGWTYIHLRTGHGWKPARARRATVDVALNGLAG
jgi:AcrR family transcriptional regulator